MNQHSDSITSNALMPETNVSGWSTPDVPFPPKIKEAGVRAEGAESLGCEPECSAALLHGLREGAAEWPGSGPGGRSGERARKGESRAARDWARWQEANGMQWGSGLHEPCKAAACGTAEQGGLQYDLAVGAKLRRGVDQGQAFATYPWRGTVNEHKCGGRRGGDGNDRAGGVRRRPRSQCVARHSARVKRWGLGRAGRSTPGIGRQHIEAELWLAACLA